MAYDTNRFCWQGCMTTDIDTAKAFYTQTLGWETPREPMGDGMVDLFTNDGRAFAHLGEAEPAGAPSHWTNYLRVDDVDRTTVAATEAGGAQLVPPTDIPPGRFSVVASPSGAVLLLFKEADPDAAHAEPTVGGVHWVELHSTSLEADLAWLKTVFGFETQAMQMPDGPYFILVDGTSQRGGVTAASDGMPSAWLTWIHVEDADATASAAASHGGKVVAPGFDVPGVGRLAILADPTGGVFGVITPPAD